MFTGSEAHCWHSRWKSLVLAVNWEGLGVRNSQRTVDYDFFFLSTKQTKTSESFLHICMSLYQKYKPCKLPVWFLNTVSFWTASWFMYLCLCCMRQIFDGTTYLEYVYHLAFHPMCRLCSHLSSFAVLPFSLLLCMLHLTDLMYTIPYNSTFLTNEY